MKIFINSTNLNKGGGIQAGDALVRTLGGQHHDFTVCASKELLRSLGDDFRAPDNVALVPAPPRSMAGRLWGAYPALDRLVRECSADAAFTLFGPPFWHPRVPHLCGFAKAQFIYLDSQFFRRLGVAARFKQHLKRIIQMRSFRRDADAYVTENCEISSALRKLIPGKPVHTVSNSCNPVFDRREEWRAHPLPPFDGVTLLTVAADYPHKNLGVIPAVAKYLRERRPEFKFRFVATLPPESFGFTAETVPEWLLPVGKVDIRECPSLYEQCDFMFLPTLLECFSASYAEAMKMARPILTSDLPFARGLCGDAAEYFDPLSPEDIGEAVYRLANAPERRRALVEAGAIRGKSFPDAETRTASYIRILEKLISGADK